MIAFRQAKPDDRFFVIDAWIQSYRTSRSAGILSMESWRPVMWPQIERILDMEGTETLVAYETEEESRYADLYGFISFNVSVKPPIVFYAYVKQAYRKAGIARRLFGEAGINPESRFTYACKTGIVHELERKIPFARHNNLVARFDKPQGDQS